MNILITGGAGFIGSNTTEHFLKKGDNVTILDNFSRDGSKKNADWLKTLGKKISIVEGDVLDKKVLQSLINNVDVVIHLAAQVAVTSSVQDPETDFSINALGTLNVLEVVRNSHTKPVVIYASTNKVYGEMENLKVVEKQTRYDYDQINGISEETPLDFHSPYGCSKGAADQYVHDYARIYNLKTIVFRQSCIYGPHQFGIEDQGWVAWFIIALALNKKLTIYGDGKQVRDVLYISDLINAYDLAINNISKTAGQIYNIGGGPKNSISVWYEFAPVLEKLFNQKITVNFSDWRPGDQKIFISDISKAKKDFDWSPKISPEEGIEKLYSWVRDNKNLFE